jgi:hypothetical protein
MVTVCQFAEKERGISRIVMQKLLTGDDVRDIVCKELTILSAQLKDMKIKYTVCGNFTLKLKYMCWVSGVIISRIVIVVDVQ